MRALALAPVAVGLAGTFLILAFAGEFPLAQRMGPALLLGVAVITSAAGLLLPRVIARFDSLRHEILIVSLAAMLTAGATIALSAALMMVSSAQLGVLLIVSLVGAAFGILLEYAVGRELAADVRRLRATAGRLARGELDARSGIERSDEIGQAARALDTMAARLVSLEAARTDAHSTRQAFLAAVGHDLRSPLTALRAALEAIEDGLAPDPARYFSAMRADMEAIRRLVDDLYLLARIEGGGLEFEWVVADLSELADEAVEALAPVAVQKRVRLRVRAADGTMALVGTSEMSRVMRNLVDNAIRHAPEDSEVLVDLAQADRGVVVRVHDEGKGFDPNVRTLLLGGAAEIARPAARGGGAGLGLAIVRRLLEAHDGRIWFEEGGGGRVAFWVPARR